MTKNKLTIPEGFVEYQESDLRFTGWEHECIIIDRTANHYFIPIARHNEMLATKNLFEREPGKDSGYERIVINDDKAKGYRGVAGSIGCSGTRLPSHGKWGWRWFFYHRPLTSIVVKDLTNITYYQTSSFATYIPKITVIVANDHNDRFIRYGFENLGICLTNVKIKMQPKIQWIHQ